MRRWSPRVPEARSVGQGPLPRRARTELDAQRGITGRDSTDASTIRDRAHERVSQVPLLVHSRPSIRVGCEQGPLRLAERAFDRAITCVRQINRDPEPIHLAHDLASTVREAAGPGAIESRGCARPFPLWLYWWLRGRHDHGRRFAETVLQQSNGLADDVYARAALGAATMAFAMDDVTGAAEWWRLSHERAGDVGRELRKIQVAVRIDQRAHAAAGTFDWLAAHQNPD